MCQSKFFLVALGLVLLLASSEAKALQQSVDLSFSFEEVLSDGQGREVAATFHDLILVDEAGRTLERIEFGQSTGHAIQVSGWFADETGAPGPVQAAAQAATISLTVPSGTEGLIFTVSGVVEAGMADVTVNGSVTTHLRIDPYWHQAYVPLGDPVPEILPEPGLTWFEDRNFPEFPDTDRVISLSVQIDIFDRGIASLESFRLNQSYLTMQALTLVGMQGLINRHLPRVYLNWQTDDRSNALWLEEIGKHVEVIELTLDPLSAIHFLWRRYSNLFSGTVLYDPDVANTVNLATMLAGHEDRLILAPDQMSIPGMPVPQDVTDLSVMATAESWDNTEEGQFRLYQWVYDNLWPHLEQRIIGVISPGQPMGGDLDDDTTFYPLGLAERDLYVALKLTALYLDPENEPQRSLWEQFLDDAPSPTPITGVFRNNEQKIAERAAEHGDWIAGLSWPGYVLNAGNFSVMGGVRPDVPPAPLRMDPDRIMQALSAEFVTTLWAADGDHAGAQHQFGPFYADLQQQRLGYSIISFLPEISPVMWDYFSRPARDPHGAISVLNAVNAGGHTFPMRMSEDDLAAYLDGAAQMMDRSGMSTVFVFDEGAAHEDTRRLAQLYHEKLGPKGTLGLLMSTPDVGVNYTLRRHSAPQYAGIPFPQVWLRGRVWPDSNPAGLAAYLASLAPMGTWLTEFEDSSPTMDAVVDPDANRETAVIISGDVGSNPSCCMTAVAERVALPPGDYLGHFRMKVSDTASTALALSISAVEHGSADPGAVQENIQYAPSDFSAAMVYEDITIPFSLDHVSRNLEVWLDYSGGPADVYVDDFRVERLGDPIVPFSAARMYMGFAFVGHDFTLPGQFVDALEAEGGFFLYPEEFIASLNPEYMIDFAHQYLPAGDPLVAEAESELDKGHYFNAVLKVREALLAGTGVATQAVSIPDSPVLEVFPNPSDQTTTIRWWDSVGSRVNVQVYDMLGRRVDVFSPQPSRSGWRQATLDTSRLASGVYLVRVETQESPIIRKVVVRH